MPVVNKVVLQWVVLQAAWSAD